MNKEKLLKINKYILIFIGIAVTANAVISSALSNMNAGIAVTYALGFVFLIYGVFYKEIVKIAPKFIRYIFVCGVAAAAAAVTALFMYGVTDSVTYNEDAVIVLGAGIRGEEIGDDLRNRLDSAIAYHRKNPDAVIVVSGGQGPEETITESLAMARYLSENGVSESLIIKEDRATSTYENFLYSKELLDAHFDDDYTVAFITTDYHIYRAEYTADAVGFDSITHTHNSAPWFAVIPSGLRECMAIVRVYVFGLR